MSKYVKKPYELLADAEMQIIELQARLDAVDTAAWDKLKDETGQFQAELSKIRKSREFLAIKNKDYLDQISRMAAENEEMHSAVETLSNGIMCEKDAEIKRFKDTLKSIQSAAGLPDAADACRLTLALSEQALKGGKQ